MRSVLGVGAALALRLYGNTIAVRFLELAEGVNAPSAITISVGLAATGAFSALLAIDRLREI